MNTARTETKPGTERLAKQNDAKYLTRDWIVKEKYWVISDLLVIVS